MKEWVRADAEKGRMEEKREESEEEEEGEEGRK